MMQAKVNSSDLDNIKNEISRVSIESNNRAQTMSRDLDTVMTQMG